MTRLRVDASARLIETPLGILPCAIGSGGAIAATDKREGDAMTPLGTWPIRAALLRPDRVTTPHTELPWRWLRSNDGWSDTPGDAAYNRAIRHPHAFGAERLWRDDALYDVIIVLGYNDAPPVSGAGSAIFLHAMPLGGTTAGCVAIEREPLITLLPLLAPGDAIIIA